MRIGTWNLEGKWSSAHQQVLDDLACDVWLVTEAPACAGLQGYDHHLSTSTMGASVHWAAILSRSPMSPGADPHPASVAATIGDVDVVCSVLPWPLSGPTGPWDGRDHLERVTAALEAVGGSLHRGSVWGGDWNQPLTGNISGFNRSTQAAILARVADLDLRVVTAALPGRRVGQATIDHIAVPSDWTMVDCGRSRVAPHVSDHDAYWADAHPPVRG